MTCHETAGELATARLLLAQQLESLHAAGVLQIGKVPPPATTAKPTAPASARAARELSSPERNLPTPRTTIEPTEEPDMPRAKHAEKIPGLSLLAAAYPADLPTAAAGRQALLDQVNQKVAVCPLCKELACTRTQTVFGVGNLLPRVAFFGEAPGADEDRQGVPFVGRAGQLLTKIIEACGWQRDDVYILNVLKCRPPDNRNPLPQEVANCRPYFERQFEVLQPEYIVCLGSIAAQSLLETAEAVGKLRGRFHKYRDSQVLVTYHPSYLLRNPPAKKYVWEDMQLLLGAMGLPIPQRAS
ncbi:MAG: uracil-DNA glycosylase [Pirellulaceae bacterium]